MDGALGSPWVTGGQLDVFFETVAHLSRNTVVHILSRRILWETVSQVLLKSKNIIPTTFLDQLSGLHSHSRRSCSTSGSCPAVTYHCIVLLWVFQYLHEYSFPWCWHFRGWLMIAPLGIHLRTEWIDWLKHMALSIYCRGNPVIFL